MKYSKIREEALKLKVAKDWFGDYDCTRILGNIDFCAEENQKTLLENHKQPLLWAEAKTGDFDEYKMFSQLILTIGKEKTHQKTLPPNFLGVFDFVKIIFIPYNAIEDIFEINDFNWNVTPSNHETREFEIIKSRVKKILKEKTKYIYNYEKNEKELKNFIKNTLRKGTQKQIKITKNNFKFIFEKWHETLQPNLDVSKEDWQNLAKNYQITETDFYLADVFIDDKGTPVNISDDETTKRELFVVKTPTGYEIKKSKYERFSFQIKDQNVYKNFWKDYKRPPSEEYGNYILSRRDILVSQDTRERTGAFFTPKIWVEKSQKYLEDYFGENWQEEYYIWDCAAGTGNLLFGLTNKYNIFASTLDPADVNVMKSENNGLLENHIFQFDFLNDDLYGEKVPESLKEILRDEEKRKKLIIYINPPYAEAGTTRQRTGTGENKAGTATGNMVHKKYADELGKARNELFVQFLYRIYKEIDKAKIANFSTLKNLQSPNFIKFRDHFRAKLEKLFLVPGNTFDNVKGQFPIGFFIWNTEKDKRFIEYKADIYNQSGDFTGMKWVFSHDDVKGKLNDWIRLYYNENQDGIGKLRTRRGNDYQNNATIFLTNNKTKDKNETKINIVNENLLPIFIYFSVRLCLPATWINDRDQFLFPQNGHQSDFEFQGDCLAFTLFHGQNRITSADGINHWIPFTENQVDAKEKFTSNFMTDFIKEHDELVWSEEAKEVFDAGQKLWTYYHRQDDSNPNASFYDIRSYFQGHNPRTGRMNAKSDDPKYSELIGDLRQSIKNLGNKIAEKVYEYEFLKK